MRTKFFIIALYFILPFSLYSQPITKDIKGIIIDESTKEPLPFATVIVENSDPLIGTVSDYDGKFILKNVPVGRYRLVFSTVGYESYILNELLITSGTEVNLIVELRLKLNEIDQVVVKSRKDEPTNSMTTLSSRQFTVEETQRYAGGLNDPARLVSSFAGVATPSVSSNGISVRGNNPSGLLWQIEGVEVPNPNHFADLTVMGGGLLTAISSQMMGNSDFYTGAFPAEYGNATSGVFDIKLRNGNQSKNQFAVQAGLIGLDFSAEGPFIKKKSASYLFNYRYSTMTLILPLLPDNTGALKYQDLAFKTNFPTQKSGTFSWWGIGALDGQQMDPADSSGWEMNADRDRSETSLYMFATGLSHRYKLAKKTFLNTTLFYTGSGLFHEENRTGFDLVEYPYSDVENSTWRAGVQSYLNHYFSDKHSNRTGFKYSRMGYGINILQSQNENELPDQLAKSSGYSDLIQMYTQSKIYLPYNLTLNAGIHGQIFLLNQSYSIEPRLGLKYQINSQQSIALAYGLHSRIEPLSVYFNKIDGTLPNKNLDLMKSHHYVLSYNSKINDKTRLTIEPYYQKLTNVPVSPDSYISSLNFEEELFFNEKLISSGKGRNIGVDVTIEQFLNNGFYYLVTTSLFDSKYTGADGIERNTRFNKNYVLNALAGKEWKIGKAQNDLLSLNFRLNYMGGNRKEPIDLNASLAGKEIVYLETDGTMAFNGQFKDQPIVSFSLSYRRNKSNYSSVWSLQILNLFSTQEFDTDFYNIKTGKVETQYAGIQVPNLSYKIEF